jgi:hypothetical protein
MPMPPARPASEAFPVVRRAGYGASTLLSTFLTDRPVRPCFPDTVERMFAEDRDERKCSFPECNRAYYAKALCRAHYQQQLHKRPLQPIRPWRRVPTECEFEGCDKKATNRGLCPAHALQRNKGQELRPLRPFYGTKGPCRFDGCLNLAWLEATAQGTPPNTTVGGRWLLSSSQRRDAILPIAPNDILPLATARVIGVNCGRSDR